MSNIYQASSGDSQFLKDYVPELFNHKKVVVAGFLENEGKVFLARRSATKKIASSMLHLPGGHSEPRESLEATLVREFMEEFHLDIRVGELVHTFEYVRGDVHTDGFVFFVQADVLPKEIHFDPQDNSEILWASRMDLGCLFADHTDHNVIAAEKGFDILRERQEPK